MPPLGLRSIGATATLSVFVAAIVWRSIAKRYRHLAISTDSDVATLRAKLPSDLKTWRKPPGYDVADEPCEEIWAALRDFFAKRGYHFWNMAFMPRLRGEFEGIRTSGFMYSLPHCALEVAPGNIGTLLEYDVKNPLTRPARTADGRDVVIRVLAIGSEGKEHVELLKLIAEGLYGLFSVNHTLPLQDIIVFDDITFGIFPKVGQSVSYAFGFWARTLVSDVLDIIAQCLEALVFLHDYAIAHRDVFKDNLLIEWMPETGDAEHPPIARPRVYLNDFELAIHFPPDVPPLDWVVVGPPLGGSLPDHNGRPMPPEVLSGAPYSPFKLDVWQLGTTFSEFKSTIPSIDAVLTSMTDPNPATRPVAHEALKALVDAMNAIPPQELMIEHSFTNKYPLKSVDA